MEIHHVPQKHAAQQVVVDYDAKKASSITLPAQEHRQIPNIRGKYDGTPRDLLARDAKNLRDYTGADNTQIKGVIDLAKRQSPGSYIKEVK